jgi:hypothetical protein
LLAGLHAWPIPNARSGWRWAVKPAPAAPHAARPCRSVLTPCWGRLMSGWTPWGAVGRDQSAVGSDGRISATLVVRRAAAGSLVDRGAGRNAISDDFSTHVGVNRDPREVTVSPKDFPTHVGPPSPWYTLGEHDLYTLADYGWYGLGASREVQYRTAADKNPRQGTETISISRHNTVPAIIFAARFALN